MKNIGDCRCLNQLDKYAISEALSNDINNKKKKLGSKAAPASYWHIRDLEDLRNRIEEIPEC